MNLRVVGGIPQGGPSVIFEEGLVSGAAPHGSMVLWC
jgi:hypothetical protein